MENLNREALVYVCQSTMAQVRFKQESIQRQHALQERAISLGWAEEHIRIIVENLSISGLGCSKRPGFVQLVSSVSLGEVDAVFGLEISHYSDDYGEQLAAIHGRMVKAGISNAGGYMRKIALNGYILHIDLTLVNELVSLQRHCSNIFNQVAVHANTYGGGTR